MARVRFDDVDVEVEVTVEDGHVKLAVTSGGLAIRGRIGAADAIELGAMIERVGEEAAWSKPKAVR
jgi:hypothetical protein